MYDVIRTTNVTVDFCPQMTLPDVFKIPQIGLSIFLVNSFMILAPSNAIPNIKRVNSPISPNQPQGQSTQQLNQPTQIQTTQIQPTQIQWAGQNIQVLSGSGSSTGFQVVDLRNTQVRFQI